MFWSFIKKKRKNSFLSIDMTGNYVSNMQPYSFLSIIWFIDLPVGFWWIYHEKTFSAHKHQLQHHFRYDIRVKDPYHGFLQLKIVTVILNNKGWVVTSDMLHYVIDINKTSTLKNKAKLIPHTIPHETHLPRTVLTQKYCYGIFAPKKPIIMCSVTLYIDFQKFDSRANNDRNVET